MGDGELLDRFLSGSDDEAFESLVLRHGPLVHRVCREILRNPHDVEDAFQATFLVLIRNARSIRDRDSLGRWLYGVAQRVAYRARSKVSRRSSRETSGVDNVAAKGDDAALRTEIRPVLHEEITRLPESLRSPLLLCYFEGLSQEEAARRLRVPLGTLKGRLTRGRDQLRRRLTKRGMTATALLLLLLLEQKKALAVPPELVNSTIRSGTLARHLKSLPETVPNCVFRLAEREHLARSPQMRVLVSILLAACAFSLGLGGSRVIAQWSPISALFQTNPLDLLPVDCRP